MFLIMSLAIFDDPCFLLTLTLSQGVLTEMKIGFLRPFRMFLFSLKSSDRFGLPPMGNVW
jgi:hypothetical protein